MTRSGTGIPRATVSPPPLGAAAPFGLFSTATIGEGVDPHQLNGVEYQTVCSTQVEPWFAACGTRSATPDVNQPLPAVKQAGETAGFTVGDPFAVYAAETCLLGNPDPDGLERLRRRFTLGEPAAVEHLFFTGQLGNRPSLQHGTDDGTTSPTGRPVILGDQTKPLKVTEAIGLLEHWIACTSGSTGVIHAPRYMAEMAGAASPSLLGNQGPQVRTKLGTLIAYGTGYPGTPPTGAKDEGTNPKTWLYATLPPTVRRSTVVEPEPWGVGNVDPYGQPELAPDQRTRPSDAGFRLLERTYVIDIPCGQVAAVRTDLPLLSPQPTKKEGAE